MKAEELNDELKTLGENLTKEEKEQLAIDCSCSLSTVYNYLGGKQSNIHLARALRDGGNKIISERPVPAVISQ